MKKALVISGGGSKGAFAGGVAEYLLKEKKNTYDIFLGTSSGSLMVSHLALGEIDPLKTIYTGVNQRSIFNINPFKIILGEHSELSSNCKRTSFQTSSKGSFRVRQVLGEDLKSVLALR